MIDSFKSAPLPDIELEIIRDRDIPRDIEIQFTYSITTEAVKSVRGCEKTDKNHKLGKWECHNAKE